MHAAAGAPLLAARPRRHGDQRGRTLGFPTANIAVTADRALPAFGIYATWAYLGETRYPPRPTSACGPPSTAQHPSVETFIFDFDGDLYDQTLRIELVARLRPEQKFDGIEALVAQMHPDAARAREILWAYVWPFHKR